eukprot:3941537-Rhodomonas_salina.12
MLRVQQREVRRIHVVGRELTQRVRASCSVADRPFPHTVTCGAQDVRSCYLPAHLTPSNITMAMATAVTTTKIKMTITVTFSIASSPNARTAVERLGFVLIIRPFIVVYPHSRPHAHPQEHQHQQHHFYLPFLKIMSQSQV